eukprot:GHUV01018940.1.p1 GENE.GHUV01018940.1~~GHUV01018940.1.p1  ORF type:complete len:137 (+),score=23.12 GHUV01018940.1:152-562(+)
MRLCQQPVALKYERRGVLIYNDSNHRGALRVKAQATAQTFLPKELPQITEPAAQQMAARIQRTPVQIPSLPIPPLESAFVGPNPQQQQQLRALNNRPPVMLLHGFDSSCLEFRRLYPLLEPQVETWAVDLVRSFQP